MFNSILQGFLSHHLSQVPQNIKTVPKKIPYISGNGTFKSKIKKILIFSQEFPLHFSPQTQKNKKIHPSKKFIIFQEMEFLCSNIKKKSGDGNAEKKKPYLLGNGNSKRAS